MASPGLRRANPHPYESATRKPPFPAIAQKSPRSGRVLERIRPVTRCSHTPHIRGQMNGRTFDRDILLRFAGKPFLFLIRHRRRAGDRRSRSGRGKRAVKIAGETGVASIYGFAGDKTAGGTKTANGEDIRPTDMSAAHKSIPFGTRVRVTNLRQWIVGRRSHQQPRSFHQGPHHRSHADGCAGDRIFDRAGDRAGDADGVEGLSVRRRSCIALLQIELSNSQASSSFSRADYNRRAISDCHLRSRCGSRASLCFLSDGPSPSQRGSRAPYGAKSPCPCKEHGTDPAGPASPYGAPLRRLQSLVPHFLLPGFRRGGKV